jgi:hypothetical protein
MRSIMTNSVSDPEMALFSSRGVLSGSPGCDAQQYALPLIPPRRDAALLAEKITHFWIGNRSVLLRAPEKNNSTSCLSYGPSTSLHPPTRIPICAGGCAL